MKHENKNSDERIVKVEQTLPPCMRRADRKVTDEKWIRDFLKVTPMGVLATTLGDQPFLTHNTFCYDPEAHVIYMHTAINGHLRKAVEENSKVCFTVAEMGRLLPADTAREMSVEYASVIVYGHASIITDMTQATEMMSLFIKKYFAHLETGADYRPITDKEIREISVFEIAIDSWSAKKKEAEQDFPGAFYYENQKVK